METKRTPSGSVRCTKIGAVALKQEKKKGPSPGDLGGRDVNPIGNIRHKICEHNGEMKITPIRFKTNTHSPPAREEKDGPERLKTQNLL